MLRFISLFALVAVALAEPEAEAQVFGYQPYAHATAGLVHHPASGAIVPDDTVSVKAAKAVHHAAKFNAYVNKPVVYTKPYVYAQQPLTYTVPAVQAPSVAYTQYAGQYASQYAAPALSYSTPYLHHVKREAEAEAEPEADPQFYYNTFAAAPQVAYNYAVAPQVAYKYAAPAVTYTTPTAVQYTAPTVYNHAAYAYAQPTYAYRHIVKREAEAEPEAKADPYYSAFYSSPYHYASTYNYGSPYAYRSPYSSYYNSYPYNYRYGY